MANLIMNAFAFKEDYKNSPQLGGAVTSSTIDIYMKNIFVSLRTAQINNPKDEVALIVNTRIPIKFEKMFKKCGIKIKVVEFEKFNMPKRFVWSLAFYKLCALDYMVNNFSYDRYLLIDADTIIVDSFEELWEECAEGILLLNTGHRLKHKERQYIIKDYEKLYGEKRNITHFGGELIGGYRNELKKFLEKCEKVYEKIKESNYNVADNIGDETITSIAAYRYPNIVSAQPYIYRYWTGRFYLVSTNYKFNPVAIWHLPNEKELGILEVFDYIEKYDKLPERKKLEKLVGLPTSKRKIDLNYIYKVMKRKMLK